MNAVFAMARERYTNVDAQASLKETATAKAINSMPLESVVGTA